MAITYAKDIPDLEVKVKEYSPGIDPTIPVEINELKSQVTDLNNQIEELDEKIPTSVLKIVKRTFTCPNIVAHTLISTQFNAGDAKDAVGIVRIESSSNSLIPVGFSYSSMTQQYVLYLYNASDNAFAQSQVTISFLL